ncbi:hypothetical protein [Nocardia cyriacigeorgica]|uniref:MaoC-like domain-containing protein n=1 Tax=Nocardia cyriacigeorgica TaxID=135487 RepID=A0A4U8VUY4_9NOCA|nr:hypothetical protein [Nocardia cyriacigeorgica]MBF6100357.1 hypothetical protein [Nocardia cyriacigeorgica]MBF6161956.1 hypothetical protein [Nocardia cyriacigeorgica]MBF6200982.1 hypothetical protein [Nocardia cyriacigeorgica]MBF6320189.1 hypothetical protein [Nocardia cyriacigeorgica]MBF6534325.1 hypothetical protein [Nocardia cyriacigeorgica]
MTATAPAPTTSFGPLTDADFARYAVATQTLASGSETPGDAPSFTASAGPLAAALLATYATDWLGSETVRRFRTRCARPLWPGDTLTCSGYVVQHYVLDGESCVDVTLVGTDQDGRVAARAWATFVCD